MGPALTGKRRLSVPVFIREPYSPESEFVRKDTFNAHMQRIEALMELNMAEQKAMNERLNSKIDGVNDSLNAKIDSLSERLNSKIDGVNDSLNAKIDGVNDSLNAKMDSLSERLDSKIDGIRSELKSDIKVLHEQLNHAVDTLTVAINRNDVRMDGFEKRLDDMSQYQQKWFTLLGILVAVVPIAVALLQGIIAK